MSFSNLHPTIHIFRFTYLLILTKLNQNNHFQKFQNSGVGSKLLSFVENLGKISKLDTYDVTTEVKYYKNRGYEEISRHYIVNLESSYDKDFLKKPGLQSVFMEKKIIKTDEV